MKKIFILSVILVITAQLTTLSSTPLYVPDSNSKKSINSFSVDIFKREVAANKAKNVVISPLSIYIALAMAYNGADGKTKSEIGTAMHLQKISEKQLNSTIKGMKTAFDKTYPSTELRIANSIWSWEANSFLPSYKTLCKNYFNADALIIPKTSPEKAVNNWVKAKTKNKIKSIVGRLTRSETALVLLNAVYFNGKWEIPFKTNNTMQETFNISKGKTLKVPMMCIKDKHFDYYRNNEMQVVCLPYKYPYKAYIFLASESITADSFIKSLSADKISSIISKMKSQEGTVKLPRFKLDEEQDLKVILKQMGVKTAFSNSDLSRMSNINGLFIKDVLHKTYIDMNEQGTEAAAVTEIHIALSAHIAPTAKIIPFYFHANRPYVIAITYGKFAVPIFMGVINNPAK